MCTNRPLLNETCTVMCVLTWYGSCVVFNILTFQNFFPPECEFLHLLTQPFQKMVQKAFIFSYLIKVAFIFQDRVKILHILMKFQSCTIIENGKHGCSNNWPSFVRPLLSNLPAAGNNRAPDKDTNSKQINVRCSETELCRNWIILATAASLWLYNHWNYFGSLRRQLAFI